MMPANGAAWTYLIYASALLPLCASLPLTLWLQAALTATFVFDAEVLAGFPTLLATASGVVVCNAVFATNLFLSYERRRQAELRLSHDEVRRLAATAERERIGRDLHDLLGHTLSLIAIKSELARRLLDRDTAAARRELAEIERVARGSLAEVRGAVTGMRAALLASELASAKLMLETAGIRFAHRIQAVSMPADVEAALAFGLREAVTNVQRHAVAATRVEVDLEQQDGAVLLTIRDDGCGGVHAKGNGLSGMQERLEALGGRLEIDSPPRAGAELRLRVPL
ncbi:MAG: sensor histidine kinase, partial [Gammaproteobacteria bacterium]|nr:sensor histidine kinase [Gammaproteobacteria bacterium]